MGKNKRKRDKAGYNIIVPSDNKDVPDCYRIDLDQLDLGLLSFDRLFDKLRSKPDREELLLWEPGSEKTATVRESGTPVGLQFTVHAVRDTESTDGNPDTLTSSNEQPSVPPTDITGSYVKLATGPAIQCHICSLAVPEEFVIDHARSKTHLALLRLTNTAMSRFTKYTEQHIDQMTRDIPEDSLRTPECQNSMRQYHNHPGVHYCVLCNATLEPNLIEVHERGLTHLCSVKRHHQLAELCRVYMNDLAIVSTEGSMYSSHIICSSDGASSANMVGSATDDLATEKMTDDQVNWNGSLTDDVATSFPATNHPATNTYSAIVRKKSSEGHADATDVDWNQLHSEKDSANHDSTPLYLTKKATCTEDTETSRKNERTEKEMTIYVSAINDIEEEWPPVGFNLMPNRLLQGNKLDWRTTISALGETSEKYGNSTNAALEENERDEKITNRAPTDSEKVTKSASQEFGTDDKFTYRASEDSITDSKILISATEMSNKDDKLTNSALEEIEKYDHSTHRASEECENHEEITNNAPNANENNEKLHNCPLEIERKNYEKDETYASENYRDNRENTKLASEKGKANVPITNSLPGSTETCERERHGARGKKTANNVVQSDNELAENRKLQTSEKMFSNCVPEQSNPLPAPTKNPILSVDNVPKLDTLTNNMHTPNNNDTKEATRATYVTEAAQIEELDSSEAQTHSLETNAVDSNSTQWYYCEACQTSVPNHRQNITEHDNGKKHKKIVAANNNQIQEANNSVQQSDGTSGTVKREPVYGLPHVNVNLNREQDNESKSENNSSAQESAASTGLANGSSNSNEDRDDTQWYYHCDVCEMYIPNQRNKIKAHIEGYAHRSKTLAATESVWVGSSSQASNNAAPSCSKPKKTRENAPKGRFIKDLDICPLCPGHSNNTAKHLNSPIHQQTMDAISRHLRVINFTPLKESLTDNAIMPSYPPGSLQPVISKANWNGLVADEAKMEYHCILCQEIVGYTFVQYHNHVATSRHKQNIEAPILETGCRILQDNAFDYSYHCIVCNVTFRDDTDNHCESSLHQMQFNNSRFSCFREDDVIITHLRSPEERSNPTSEVVSDLKKKVWTIGRALTFFFFCISLYYYS